MASNTPNESHLFRPERTENILADDTRPNYGNREIEHALSATPDSSISEYGDKQTLERRKTNSSTREPKFESIVGGERQQLERIASQFGGSVALARTRTNASSKLSRRDTLAGVEFGDPVLDPSSPEFDVYKWVRM